MPQLNELANLGMEDISVEYEQPSKTEMHQKDTNVNSGTRGESIFSSAIKESMILQVLEQKGVKGVPRVLRTEYDTPLSKSGQLKATQDTHGNKYAVSVGLEKVPGKNWAEHRFKNEAEIIRAGISAAAVLREVYNAGFVHNDIKPSNLMIDSQGNVTLIDFNGAERHDEDGNYSGLYYTSYYSSPEKNVHQPVAGTEKRFQSSVSSDMYSLALTLAKKAGVDLDRSWNDLTKTRDRAYLLSSLEEAVQTGRISEKFAIFIGWETSENIHFRSQNYDQYIRALEWVADDQINSEFFVDYLNATRNQKQFLQSETKTSGLPAEALA